VQTSRACFLPKKQQAPFHAATYCRQSRKSPSKTGIFDFSVKLSPAQTHSANCRKLPALIKPRLPDRRRAQRLATERRFATARPPVPERGIHAASMCVLHCAPGSSLDLPGVRPSPGAASHKHYAAHDSLVQHVGENGIILFFFRVGQRGLALPQIIRIGINRLPTPSRCVILPLSLVPGGDCTE
jgi:hypothetical protein